MVAARALRSTSLGGVVPIAPVGARYRQWEQGFAPPREALTLAARSMICSIVFLLVRYPRGVSEVSPTKGMPWSSTACRLMRNAAVFCSATSHT